MSKKPATLFDHLTNLTSKKIPWESLTDADKKSFSSYMINRFISMNIDLTELVNELQKYTIGVLSNEHVYKLYHDILPKSKMYFKYVKGKKTDKYNKDLVELISKHFQVSYNEAEDYIDLLDKDSLSDIIKRYGKTESEVKKLLK